MECGWAKAKKRLPENASVDDLLALQRFCDACPKPHLCGVQDKSYNSVITYKFRFVTSDDIWADTSTGRCGISW